MTKKRLEVNDLLEIEVDLAIDNTELRWGDPSAERPFLHSGRFIVEQVSPDEVRIADANWDESGRVTSHSTKHAHVIKGRGGIDALIAEARRPVKA